MAIHFCAKLAFLELVTFFYFFLGIVNLKFSRIIWMVYTLFFYYYYYYNLVFVCSVYMYNIYSLGLCDFILIFVARKKKTHFLSLDIFTLKRRGNNWRVNRSILNLFLVTRRRIISIFLFNVKIFDNNNNKKHNNNCLFLFINEKIINIRFYFL